LPVSDRLVARHRLVHRRQVNAPHSLTFTQIALFAILGLSTGAAAPL